MMALGAIRAAGDAGLNVPADLSVIGFDDIQLADHMNPPLTTVRQDKAGLGVAAGTALVRLIDGEQDAVDAVHGPSRGAGPARLDSTPGCDLGGDRSEEVPDAVPGVIPKPFLEKEERIVRSRYAILLAIAAVLVGALVYSGCGGDDEATASRAATRRPPSRTSQPGTTVKLWIMPNGPQPKEDMEASLAAVHGEDRHQGRRRGRRLGRAARPHPQRRGLGRRPGHHAGRHHPGAVLRRARRVRGPERAASRTSAARAPTPTACGRPPQVVGQDGMWAVPWFTEARSIYYRKDVLEKAGVDPATAFADWDDFRDTLQAIKDKVPGIQPFGTPGKKAFDLVHHVMPFVWDAGGAELTERQQQVDDQLAGGRPRASSSSPTWSRTGWPTRASSSVTARRSRTSSRAARSPSGSAARGCSRPRERTDDTNWVPAARKNVGAGADAGRPERRRVSRSSAART